MNRRNFLKLVGLSVAAPAAVLAKTVQQKGTDVFTGEFRWQPARVMFTSNLRKAKIAAVEVAREEVERTGHHSYRCYEVIIVDA